jgi:uncharacterized protein YcbK (DUF882 family)
MSDLVVSVRLNADGSGLVGQVKLSKDEVERLKGALGSAAQESRELATASAGVVSGAQRVAASAQTERAALQQAAQAARQKQVAMAGLGQQVNDVTQQLALGVNPAVVFAQQIGQISFAAQGLGGKLGALATTMSGPLGAAITGVVLVLGLMADKFLSNEDAADKSKKATDLHKMSIDELIEAIEEENKALGRAIQSGREAEKQALVTALAKEKEALKRRDNAKAALEEAIALQQATVSRATRGGPQGEAAALGLGRGLAGIEELRKELAKVEAGLATAGQNVRTATVPLIERSIEARLDREKGATERLEKAQDELDKQYRKGNITLQERTRRGLLLEAQSKREIALIRETEQARTKAAQTERQVGRQISGADADRILAGIGATVTSGYRSPEKNRSVGGSANSYHLTDQARDIAKTPGMTIGRIRAAFQAEGVQIRELLDEGDHFHVAWGKATDTARAAAKAARDLAQEQAELARDLATVQAAFDPAAAAAAAYAEQLARIDRLAKAGQIAPDQVGAFRRGAIDDYFDAIEKGEAAVLAGLQSVLDEHFGPDWKRTLEAPLPAVGETAADELGRAARAFGDTFKEVGLDAAAAIAAAFGGRTGDALGDAFGFLLGLQTGDFRGVGGRFGAILDLLGANAGPGDPRAEGFAKAIRPLRDTLDKGLGKLGTSIQGVAQAVPYVAAGMAAVSAVSDVLGIKNRAGGLFGVGGNLILNSIIPAKRGSATITSVDGEIASRGNSAKFREASIGLAGNVQQAIAQIADALGGTIGDFAVSVGVRDGKFRLDRSGRGITKTKRGAVDFGKDEAGVTSAAVADAIADGGVQGLSAAVRQALGSSTDINKALKEALRVDELETFLAGPAGAVGKLFRDFERQAAERLRIARQYGFDVVELEKRTAADRLKLFEETVTSRVGALSDLLSDLDFGDLFEGDAAQQRTKLLAEIAKAEEAAKAGTEGAAGQVAELRRRLLEVSRDGFGTAGPEYAADRASTRSAAEEIIRLENERLKAAQEAALGTKAAVEEGNKLANETNDKLAEQAAILRGGFAGIAAAVLSLRGSGGGIVGGARLSTARQVEL